MRGVMLLLLICLCIGGCQKKENSIPTNQQLTGSHGLAFTVKAAAYEDHLQVKLQLRNTSEETVTLRFPSSQQFDVVVANKNGETLYTYAADKLFSQVLTEVTVQPGETKLWEPAWTYSVKPFKLGETYTITAKLLPIEVNGKAAEASFFEKVISYTSGDVADPTEATIDRNIHVSGRAGSYTVTGPVIEGLQQAYYSVTDGHDMLIEKTALDVKKSWTISLVLAKERLPINGTLLLELYGKKKNSDMIVRKTVILEQFQ